MKKFKVVANSTILDAEVNCHDYTTANEMFEQLRDSGAYTNIYIMDNETGELYRTYDVSKQAGGVLVQDWFSIAGDLE